MWLAFDLGTSGVKTVRYACLIVRAASFKEQNANAIKQSLAGDQTFYLNPPDIV
jgi:hypothetical protein